jgi:alpha-L-fucosidase
MLVEAVSKNGNLLLNVELFPDGSIPPEQIEIINRVGDWLRINGEAIYGTRPWKVYGDGKSVRGEWVETVDGEIRNAADNAEAMKKKGEHYNQRTTATPAYASDEVRFSTKGDNFYIVVMNPAAGELKIPSLGQNSQVNPGTLKSLCQLYDDRKISFNQTGEYLNLTIPPVNGTSYPLVLKGTFSGVRFQ